MQLRVFYIDGNLKLRPLKFMEIHTCGKGGGVIHKGGDLAVLEIQAG